MRPSHQQVIDATAEAAATEAPQRVPVNVYEAPGALVIIAPMPAVKPGDVTVELRAGKICFSAALRSSGPREYLINEWDYGNYERELDLPPGLWLRPRGHPHQRPARDPRSQGRPGRPPHDQAKRLTH